jgi:hypothetical protein
MIFQRESLKFDLHIPSSGRQRENPSNRRNFPMVDIDTPERHCGITQFFGFKTHSPLLEGVLTSSSAKENLGKLNI